MDLVRLSKSISRVLRHRPDAAGVTLDTHGWCDVDELLEGLAKNGMPTTRETLEQVVRDEDKGRYVLEGNRIRAAQGHTVEGVQPVLRAKKPPSRLFHGTVQNNMPGIERKGLLPMHRHHVHLSIDEDTTRAVGGRRGTPVVLEVDAAAMERAGHKFYVADNGVWLTDAVPRRYLQRLTESGALEASRPGFGVVLTETDRFLSIDNFGSVLVGWTAERGCCALRQGAAHQTQVWAGRGAPGCRIDSLLVWGCRVPHPLCRAFR